MSTSVMEDVAAVGQLDVVPKILETVCRTTGLRFSAVARVTDDQWVACMVRDELDFGLKPGGELKIETTFCDQIRRSGHLIAIDHVSTDKTYCDHMTPKMYGFESYISVPIRLVDGRFFGTLCALDPKPGRVETEETIAMFELFANLIALHLDSQDRLRVSEAALLNERQAAELQSQFIAILGHDLGNPLEAIKMGTMVLRSSDLDEKNAHIALLMDATATRMGNLVSNILDFARTRLGGGIPVDRMFDPGLKTALEQVIGEMRTAEPGRTIETEITLNQAVYCDRLRMGQLLSNLLGNALRHGDPDGPVRIRAHSDEQGFELSVTNLGEPLPTETIARLFQPYVRGEGTLRSGLGLGLYISAEIARAHDGSLEVVSTRDETRFTLLIPAKIG